MSITPATRGRRAKRTSGDERERAILETAEALLAERTLGEISVDDLARGAGISRPSFYFYFPSKEAVLLTLLDRLVEEAQGRQAEALARMSDDPATRLREGLTAYYETFGQHQAVVLASAAARFTSKEVRALWTEITESWIDEVTETIEAERERGTAPPGLPARDLAIALIGMNERALFATFAGEKPSLPAGSLVDVLMGVWMKAVYA